MSNDKYKHMTKLHEFQSLMRTDPRLYWSPAVQSTMQEQGEKFFTAEKAPISSEQQRKDRMAALVQELEALHAQGEESPNNG
jgi:hypothetical protein